MTLRNFYNLHFTVWRIYGRKNVKGKNKFISKSISWSINPLKPIKITVKDSQVGQGGQRDWQTKIKNNLPRQPF